MVDNELTFSYDELLDRATTIAPVTLSCVSNEVGGNLVGNAVWRGVPADRAAGRGRRPAEGRPRSPAARSTAGAADSPTEAAYDGRTALVAVGMNDEPLPLRHGFPARLVVSGLYGYVSATKWLKEIELTTFEDFNGYWIPIGAGRSWARSRPSPGSTPPEPARRSTPARRWRSPAWPGPPNSGITRVEVQVDDGEWQEATLGQSDWGPDAWLQWLLPWTATPGRSHPSRSGPPTAPARPRPPNRDPAGPRAAPPGWHKVGIEVA